MATTNLFYPSAPVEAKTFDRLIFQTCKHWIVVISVILGAFTGSPFLAPVFMKLGWDLPGRVIYFIYSFLCHQLPEVSYFLFGPKITYSLSTIQSVWQNTDSLLILRQFIGNQQMGWKVAWSDRMVFMYTSMFFLGIVWWFSRHQLKKLPWWGLVLFILPLAIDGATHTLSDLHGLGQGFRDSNVWLVNLTNNTFPISFYAGNAWDSFNDLARIVTGTLFGMGVVWFGFPYIEDAISDIIQGMQSKWYSSGFKSNNPSSVITENTHVRK